MSVPHRPLVTARTPFCKAGHSTKQFSCLHPLRAKEAAKNWSYPAVSWQRARRKLATTAALETCPATHSTCSGSTSPAFTAVQCATPHWESTEPFHQGAVEKQPSSDLHLGPFSESASAGFTCQNFGLVFPQPPALEVTPDAICPSWASWAGKLLVLDLQGTPMSCAEHTLGLPTDMGWKLGVLFMQH